MLVFRFALVLILPLLSACEKTPLPPLPAVPSLSIASAGPITPLPEKVEFNADQAALGRMLFSDPRLSRNNSIACAHCHPLDRYGTDGLPQSVGIDGRTGTMNAPTVYNSAYNFRQFWNGRAASLEAQVNGPLTHPDEMDSNWSDVLSKLNDDKAIRLLTEQAFGKSSLDADSVRSALAAFQRSLITPNAAFDRYLRGETQALTPSAQEGWRLFQEIGCISCHQGVNIGGNMYSRLGQFETYFTHREPEVRDFGRYNLTGKEEDRFKFKVPSLRNVAQTAPYFHDGAVATLPEAVERIARSQLGVQLSPEQRAAIVAFLESLTGQLPEQVHAYRNP